VCVQQPNGFACLRPNRDYIKQRAISLDDRSQACRSRKEGSNILPWNSKSRPLHYAGYRRYTLALVGGTSVPAARQRGVELLVQA
jgi:hypothetical protein